MFNTDAVRALFNAYRAQDRETAERLLADNLTFTSPQDDHIDRATYFQRCFPTAGRFTFNQSPPVARGNGRVYSTTYYACTWGLEEGHGQDGATDRP